MMSFPAGHVFNLPVCVSTSRPPSERCMRMLERAARLPAVMGGWGASGHLLHTAELQVWLQVASLPSALFFSRLFLTYMQSSHYPSSQGGYLCTCTFPCRCFSRENSWSNGEVVPPRPGLLPRQKIPSSFLIRGGNRRRAPKVFANAFLQWVISYRVSSNKDKPEVDRDMKSRLVFPQMNHIWKWCSVGSGSNAARDVQRAVLTEMNPHPCSLSQRLQREVPLCCIMDHRGLARLIYFSVFKERALPVLHITGRELTATDPPLEISRACSSRGLQVTWEQSSSATSSSKCTRCVKWTEKNPQALAKICFSHAKKNPGRKLQVFSDCGWTSVFSSVSHANSSKKKVSCTGRISGAQGADARWKTLWRWHCQRLAYGKHKRVGGEIQASLVTKTVCCWKSSRRVLFDEVPGSCFERSESRFYFKQRVADRMAVLTLNWWLLEDMTDGFRGKWGASLA